MTVVEQLDEDNDRICNSCGGRKQADYEIRAGILGNTSLGIALCKDCAKGVMTGLESFLKGKKV